MATCPSCSNPIDYKTKFCPYCDVEVAKAYAPSKDASGAIVGASNQVSSLVTRYKDGYLVVRAVDNFGGLIKVLGIIAGGLIVLVGFVSAASGNSRDASSALGGALGVMMIVFGVIAGTLFYLLGVLVSAQGQILKASLDSAVNSSPFLTNQHRAKIMSLPDA